MENPTAITAQPKARTYKEERFEFTLFVNDNIICKRNFKINDFIEHSMESAEFKNTVDNIVRMIDDDLKSKSRVYTWYFFNPNEETPAEEFTAPLLSPWECTFKLVISDRRHPVMTKIWDGYAYPRSVRDKVDIGNKFVKLINRDGKQFVLDKETFFNDPSQRMNFDLQVLRSQIMDKSDLLLTITKTICESCSPSGGMFTTTSDYTLSDNMGDKHYNYNIKAHNRRIEKEWEDATKKKTNDYFKNLF